MKGAIRLSDLFRELHVIMCVEILSSRDFQLGNY